MRKAAIGLLVLSAVGCASSGGPPPNKESTSFKSSSRRKVPTLTVAVLPFANRSQNKKLDPYRTALADAVGSELSAVRGVSLVERERLETMIEEMRLGIVGAIDPSTAARIGRLSGAEILAIGSISEIGGSIRLNIRLIRTESGVIVRSVTKRGRGMRRLDEMAEAAAKELAQALKDR